MRRVVIPSVLLLLAVPACETPTTPEPTEEPPQQVIARQAAEIEQLKQGRTDLEAQVDALKRQLAAALDLREFADAAVTVESAYLGRFSHVADIDKDRPGPDGVKVYLYLYDRDNTKIKRAGRIKLKAFDLRDERKLGDWNFDPRQALEHWERGLLLDCYVFELPWQTAPPDGLDKVTLYWRFTALDGRSFDGSAELKTTDERTP